MSTAIVVFQEHDAMRRALRWWLETLFPPCQVIEATSEAEAMTMAGTSSPCVIIMDIELPYVSGLETVRKFNAAVPAVQVVILARYEAEVYQAAAMAAGASAYLPKWTMLAELQPTLAGLLSY